PAPDATNAYIFVVGDSSSHVVAGLTDLPADYDLYLVDESGAVLAQSVQDGSTPEVIDAELPPGRYLLYVHVDQSLVADPDNPYRVQLSLGPPSILQAGSP